MKTIQSSIIREEIIIKIRNFFYKNDFHEVIPDILNEALPLEQNLSPFSTVWKTVDENKTMYLSMSPERGLKKMLARGMGNCFTISKSFRNLEQAGSLHFPEFLMLEWYRKDATYTEIMTDVENLFSLFGFKKKWPVFSIKKLFKARLKIDLEKAIRDEKILFEHAQKKGYQTDGATWSQIYDQLFVNEIEPMLPKEPLFLVDFQTQISPLCKPQKDNPLFAERFEVYIEKIEIGNGNTENTDAKAVRKVFERENKLTGLPIDEEFLDSLELMNDKSYAGVGIGLDRVVMILTSHK